MTYTNLGLVKYCKEALKLKTVYMWGGLFREVTKSYINQLSGMYPEQYGESRKNTLLGLCGKGYYGCDCVGLVKSYYFGGVGVAKNAKGYVGAWDYGVGSMYNAAKAKGKIETFPKHAGQLVMTSDFGHVGVYIGNGEVIECTLSRFGDGVVKTRLSDRSWAWWCQCPVIIDNTGAAETNNSSGTAACTTGRTNAPVISQMIVNWPDEGFDALKKFTQIKHPLIHRGIIKVLSQNYLRYPTITKQFLYSESSNFDFRDFLEIQANAAANIEYRTLEQLQWARILYFLRTYINKNIIENILSVFLTVDTLETALIKIISLVQSPDNDE